MKVKCNGGYTWLCTVQVNIVFFCFFYLFIDQKVEKSEPIKLLYFFFDSEGFTRYGFHTNRSSQLCYYYQFLWSVKSVSCTTWNNLIKEENVLENRLRFSCINYIIISEKFVLNPKMLILQIHFTVYVFSAHIVFHHSH